MPKTVRFRSRFRSYTFRTLRFNNNVAETDDAELIAAARRDPRFGEGLDFWEDKVPQVKPAEPAPSSGQSGAGATTDPSQGQNGDPPDAGASVVSVASAQAAATLLDQGARPASSRRPARGTRSTAASSGLGSRGPPSSSARIVRRSRRSADRSSVPRSLRHRARRTDVAVPPSPVTSVTGQFAGQAELRRAHNPSGRGFESRPRNCTTDQGGTDAITRSCTSTLRRQLDEDRRVHRPRLPARLPRAELLGVGQRRRGLLLRCLQRGRRTRSRRGRRGDPPGGILEFTAHVPDVGGGHTAIWAKSIGATISHGISMR